MSSVSGNPEPVNFNPAEQIGEVKGQEVSSLAQKMGELRNEVMESHISVSCGNNKNTYVEPELMTDNPKINQQLAQTTNAVVVSYFKDALAQYFKKQG